MEVWTHGWADAGDHSGIERLCNQKSIIITQIQQKTEYSNNLKHFSLSILKTNVSSKRPLPNSQMLNHWLSEKNNSNVFQFRF